LLWDGETAPGLAAAAGLRVLRCDEASVVANYDSAHAALRSFRQIGAVFQGQPGHRPLGPGQARRLLAAYARLAEAPGRVPVTHRVQYLIAEKPR
jgi:malonyl-CoA O-methyltransferase